MRNLNATRSQFTVHGLFPSARFASHLTLCANGGLQFPASGGADKFLKFIETELIPDIEKRYRVQPYRILAGHSFGGLFAIHAMLSRPESFNSSPCKT